MSYTIRSIQRRLLWAGEFSPLFRLDRSNILIRYSTGSNLNTYSALIQNFYSSETAPHQAVHVAFNTGVEQGQDAGVKAYIRQVTASSKSNIRQPILNFGSSPVGVFPKPENCVFVPIPCELRFHQDERSGSKPLLSTFITSYSTRDCS